MTATGTIRWALLHFIAEQRWFIPTEAAAAATAGRGKRSGGCEGRGGDGTCER